MRCYFYSDNSFSDLIFRINKIMALHQAIEHPHSNSNTDHTKLFFKVIEKKKMTTESQIRNSAELQLSPEEQWWRQ